MTEPGTSDPATVAGAPDPPRRRRSMLRRVLGTIVPIAIGIGLIVGVLPNMADFGEVWAAIRGMTWLEATTLFIGAIWNIATYLFVIVAALPGLRLWQAFVVSQLSTAVTNTLPAGSAVGVGVSYAMYSSWGHGASSIAIATVVTGLWNNFVKLGLPIVAFALLTIRGNPNPALLSASVMGLLLLLAAIAVLGAVLASRRLAVRIGSALARAASVILGLLKRGPVTGWGEGFGRFRDQSIHLLRGRWHWITLTTIVSHVSLFLLLLMSLRHMGVASVDVTWAEALGAFAVVRLVTALPITPGGLGVVEFGMTAALVVAGGDESLVVAAVLVYRALTYLLQVPLGGVSYVAWRVTRQRATASISTA